MLGISNQHSMSPGELKTWTLQMLRLNIGPYSYATLPACGQTTEPKHSSDQNRARDGDRRLQEVGTLLRAQALANHEPGASYGLKSRGRSELTSNTKLRVTQETQRRSMNGKLL